ncbi:putative rRNA pseudouridine synthase [Thozetella sp. PMI_491]|nr:putative rRNA pseudouridine synthase [Thozetella sp. PMI_491]
MSTALDSAAGPQPGASDFVNEDLQVALTAKEKAKLRKIAYQQANSLLFDMEKFTVIDNDWQPTSRGYNPSSRPIRDYISSGVVNLDKPANPSSHEVVSWAKRLLKSEKTGHSGTLDPKVTGCLIVCIDRATRLVKSQQGAGKEYVCVIRFHDKVPGGMVAFAQALELLTGALFQRPPLISAVKRQLRIRTIYETKLWEFDDERHLGVFWVSCEAGTYIRTLCVHLGLILGVGAHMQELRRVRSGAVEETDDNFVTLHDLNDAVFKLESRGDESMIREVIQPLESLLFGYKRIIVKDSAVASICHGATLMSVGVAQAESDIDANEEVVLVTMKGEAVAIAISKTSTRNMKSMTHGEVAKVKRCIMERSLYEKQWGTGPKALEKKQLKASGQLDKYGRTNEKTPADWRQNYVDYSAATTTPATSTAVPSSAPPAAPVPAPQPADDEDKAESVSETPEKKRKHRDETAEEKAERKRLKKEKKEKKEKKREAKAAKEADN